MCLNLTEKFRPKDWNEVVEQQHIIQSLKEIINKNIKPPHMLFIGPPGVGKNTVAQIFARHYLGEGWKNHFIEQNASDSRTLVDVREKIKPLSHVKIKQIINLTEADGLIELAQQALRRIMEQTENTIFILDVNDESKIIPAIKSRCAEYRFKPLSADAVIERLYKICEAEKVATTFSQEEREGFTQIYKIAHGDMRKAINELEKIITAKKEINTRSVLELNKTISLTTDCLKTALSGDFERAKNLIEDAYIMAQYNTDVIMDGLVDAVAQIENGEVKIRLFYELGELEHKLQSTHRPLISLCAFVAFAYVVPHLKGR